MPSKSLLAAALLLVVALTAAPVVAAPDRCPEGWEKKGRCTPDPEPTPDPTEEPTAEPTEEPTAEPTEEPTEEPTVAPTEEPTVEPTEPPASGGLDPAYTPIAGCTGGDTAPLGQTDMAVNFEPLGSIWCFDLAEPPGKTAVEGANSWVDDFTLCPSDPCHSMARLDDGDLGYRVFDAAGQDPGRSQHFLNQNHWMVDVQGAFTGGASIRPDRSFRFQDGRFVVEGDFAASIPEYSDVTWGEITITSAPAPTGVFADNLYAYGQFGGHWAVGCRLQGGRIPVCAVEGPQADSPPGDGLCSEIPGGYRVNELSFWQQCGTSFGGGPWGVPGEHWRECDPNGMDMACRDRFRMEVTKDSIALYVNGELYFRDAAWPAAHQLPDSFLEGPIYAYQSEWAVRPTDAAYRYHWDHFAVNPPHGPEAGEWFGWEG